MLCIRYTAYIDDGCALLTSAVQGLEIMNLHLAYCISNYLMGPKNATCAPSCVPTLTLTHPLNYLYSCTPKITKQSDYWHPKYLDTCTLAQVCNSQLCLFAHEKSPIKKVLALLNNLATACCLKNASVQALELLFLASTTASWNIVDCKHSAGTALMT